VMELSHPWPPMTESQRVRVCDALSKPTYCGGSQMTLTKRKVGGHWVVCLQCLTCGSQHSGGALPRDQHHNWEQYPEWDPALPERYRDDAQSGLDERRRVVQAEFQRKRAAQSADYGEWLRASPQWKQLRNRVIQHHHGLCQACLLSPATQVHHKTYDFGRLPPAFELQPVCDPCHDRLHAGWPDADRK
jgi:hypothetical protein